MRVSILVVDYEPDFAEQFRWCFSLEAGSCWRSVH